MSRVLHRWNQRTNSVRNLPCYIKVKEQRTVQKVSEDQCGNTSPRGSTSPSEWNFEQVIGKLFFNLDRNIIQKNRYYVGGANP